MKSSNAVLGAVFVVVAVAVFAAIFFLLGNSPTPGSTPPGGGGGDVVDVPTDPKQRHTRPRNSGDPRGIKTPRNRNKQPRVSKITGTVTVPGGEPAAGATVTLHARAPKPQPKDTAEYADLDIINLLVDLDASDWDNPRPLHIWAQHASEADAPEVSASVKATRTADDGTYTLELHPTMGTGPFVLTASLDGSGTASADLIVPGQVVDLRLGQAGAVEGQLIADETALPVPGARLSLSGQDVTYRTTTDDQGEFQLEGVGPGEYTLVAIAEGRAPLRMTRFAVDPEGEKLMVRMPQGTELRVRAIKIEDNAGMDETPVEGAEILVLELDTLAYLTATSDVNGWATFKALPGGNWVLNGRKQGLVSFAGEITIAIDGKEPLVEEYVEFEAAEPNKIVVVDDQARPIAGMTFYSSDWDGRWDQLRSVKLPGETDTAGQYQFQFEEIGPREMIWGFKDGYAVVQAMPEFHNDGAEMRLVAYPAHTISGRVKTEDGQAVPGAIVRIEVEATGETTFEDMILLVRAREDGSYSFPHVGRGNVWIDAESADGDEWSEQFDLEVTAAKKKYTQDLTLLGNADDGE